MGIRRAGLMAVALLAVVLSTPVLSAPWVSASSLGMKAAAAAVPVVVLNGKGFGHGVGMAQDGAYWMGRAGSSDTQILGQFYPGTTLGGITGNVRVAVSGGSGSVLSFPQGGQVTGGAQPLPIPPGGQVVLSANGGRYLAQTSYSAGPGTHPGGHPTLAPVVAHAGTASPRLTPTALCLLGCVPPSTPATTTTAPRPRTTTTTAPPGSSGTTSPTTTAPNTTPGPSPTPAPAPGPGTSPPPTAKPAPPSAASSSPLLATAASGGTIGVGGRRFRGSLQLVGGSLVNQLNVEDYLRGMGEVLDPSWPAASLQAQAIAERTYAMRYMQTSGQICADTRCQVYLGAKVEYPAMDQAVAASRGQVLTYGGSLASTVFSANGGGYEATPQEGFGGSDPGNPYLRAAPYLTKDPAPWTVSVGLADLAGVFGYHGTITDVTVSQKGPSGRALAVSLVGSSGTQVVPGLVFASSLNLRSTLFTPQVGSASAAPPLPAPGTPLQGLPGALAPASPLAGLTTPAVGSGHSLFASPHAALGLPGAPLRGHRGTVLASLASVAALALLSGAATVALAKLGPASRVGRPLMATGRGARSLVTGVAGPVVGRLEIIRGRRAERKLQATT